MVDEIYDALSDATRRRILQALHNHDYPIETPSLATSEAAIFDESVQRQIFELYHIHLPKLDEADFIEWDREEEIVEKGPRFEDTLPLLNKPPSQEEK